MTTNEIDLAKLAIEREQISLSRFESILKFLGVLGACGTFAWSVYTYLDTRNRETEARKIEASKVFLERQLKLFEEATDLASRLAVSKPEKRKPEDIDRFWQLYWGELGMVERGGVERSMANFGLLLDSSGQSPNTSALGVASIGIARAARDELAQSWGVEQWRKSDKSPSSSEK